jgi:hypothetical protein
MRRSETGATRTDTFGSAQYGLRASLQLFAHRGGFLALAAAEIIELGAASAASAFFFYLNLGDARRMYREYAFYTSP